MSLVCLRAAAGESSLNEGMPFIMSRSTLTCGSSGMVSLLSRMVFLLSLGWVNARSVSRDLVLVAKGVSPQASAYQSQRRLSCANLRDRVAFGADLHLSVTPFFLNWHMRCSNNQHGASGPELPEKN